MTQFKDFMFGPNTPRLDGIPIILTESLPEGKVAVSVLSTRWGDQPILQIGARSDDHPWCVARCIVREGLRDVIAWLDDPPTYLTGREMLAVLSGNDDIWSPESGER
jgi:hypothetical protein